MWFNQVRLVIFLNKGRFNYTGTIVVVMKECQVNIKLSTRIMAILLIFGAIFLLPGLHPVYGQGGDGTPTWPLSPEDNTTVFLPIVVRAGTTSPPPPPPPPPNSPLIIDHSDVALFESIPERYLTAARNLRMLFSDRSVGSDIDQSLNCLSASSWAASNSSCRVDYYDSAWNFKTYTQTDLTNGLVPERIRFTPSTTLYNRSNWTFVAKQGTWSELTRDFIQVLAPAYINSKDVLTYQFSYLNVLDNDDIANPATGFFSNNPNRYDVYDLEAYLAQHPNKTFFFWTTSLARSIGNSTATQFNAAMRTYAVDNGYFLFDVADIEAYTDKDVPCYDNRDGVPYFAMSGASENYPDDGHFYPAICQDYTTEVDGGHLGAVAGARIRISKAFWVLMARIAGWDGVSQ